MFNPLTMEADYDELTFINNLPAYNTSVGGIEQLDLIREIQTSGNYYFQGLSFPNGSGAVTVSGNGTINGTIQVPPGTYVTSITAYSYLPGGDPLVNGFKLKIWDKGTKASIFYGDYCINGLVSSDMQQGVNPYGGEQPFGPSYLLSPFIITGPGVLGWEIVNLAADPMVIQVLLSTAVPINKASIGQRTVNKG